MTFCAFDIFQGLNPGRAIAEVKKLLAGIAQKGEPGLQGTAGLTKPATA